MTPAFHAWSSPIDARHVQESGHRIQLSAYVGDEVWWSQVRPEESGRLAVRARGADGSVRDVLPAPWSARSRVHEYGGGAWIATTAGSLVFVEHRDQRLYRLDPGERTPRPLTGADPSDGTRDGTGTRYGDLRLSGDAVLAVRERHVGGRVRRDACRVPLDGRAADDESAVTVLASGSDFLAFPRLSPDGTRLAWVAWDHPAMPWDGTRLLVAPLGAPERATVVAGGPAESVLQPEWADDGSLYLLSDRTGWWNLYRASVDRDETVPLHPVEGDGGGPLWNLGTAWYQPLEDGRVACVHTVDGLDVLDVLDPATGLAARVDDGLTVQWIEGARAGHVLVAGAGPDAPAGLRDVDLDTGKATEVVLVDQWAPPPGYLPRPVVVDRARGREVHAFVYPPTHPDHPDPGGEGPSPYVAFVHGGPTSRVGAEPSLLHLYFTSRGIGVVEVNYGGSTGHGRPYRERLRGQWGVVDVEDTVAVMDELVARGLADPRRLAVRGGSAGGWTTLQAVSRSTTFACGAAYYGITDLADFARTTHDFESRYLDSLVGPADDDLYRRRSVAIGPGTSPVILFQGADDPIVPPHQAEIAVAALDAHGVDHELRVYPGESHGFRQAKNIVDALEAEYAFYLRHFA